MTAVGRYRQDRGRVVRVRRVARSLIPAGYRWCARSTLEERQAAELREETLEARKGSTLTDEEWPEAKTNLVNFFRILTEWQRQANPYASTSRCLTSVARPRNRNNASQ